MRRGIRAPALTGGGRVRPLEAAYRAGERGRPARRRSGRAEQARHRAAKRRGVGCGRGGRASLYLNRGLTAFLFGRSLAVRPVGTVAAVSERLVDVIRAVTQLSDHETIYAARPWTAESEALVGPPFLAIDGLHYLLEVELAKAAVEVWSLWRDGLQPTDEQACGAVIHYAEHDAWMPVEED